MNTTGMLPEAFAASISRISRSEIGMSNPLWSSEGNSDPSAGPRADDLAEALVK
jgi:hypothetical protein